MDDAARRILAQLIDDRRTQARTYLHGGHDFPVGRGEGCWIFDESGTPHLDFGPGGAIHLLGHRNPRVHETLADHLYHYTYTGEDHLARYPIEYAQALSERFPPDREGNPRKVLVLSSLSDARRLAEALTRSGWADEARTGFGRTGAMWDYDSQGLRPDVVVLGPSGGGGLPFAAVVAPSVLFDTLDELPPMANHPLACAAAKAVLDQITDELLAHVSAMGQRFNTGLAELHAQFPGILKPTSGVGLLQKIEILELGDTQKFRDACRVRGLLLHPDLQATPPLIVSEQEVNQALDVIADVCLDWS